MSIVSLGNKIKKAFSGKRRPPLVPVMILAALVIVALLAPFLAPYSPYEGSLPDKLKPPFWVAGGSIDHPLGTDKFGRDILSRLIYGARVSLAISLTALLIGSSVGTVLGLISGYFGGWVDALIMRVADIALSLPLVLMALLLVTIFGPSFAIVIIVIALLIWARYARQVRGEVLSIKEKDFVALARTAGCSHIWIMTRSIFPNLVNTLIVLITLQVGWVILLEASLSFLGVGIPPPQPAWGVMIADGRALVASAWWISVVPGVAILLVVLSLNLFGDWLRDALDPRLRQI